LGGRLGIVLARRPSPPATIAKKLNHLDGFYQHADSLPAPGTLDNALADFDVDEHCSITPLMSRKGNCWDNACSDTLFGSLKVERLYGQRFETIREAKDETIAWLLWYNQTRMHSTLGYVSPIEFEQDWKEAAIKIAA
jgi:hypothetical protein